MGGPLFGSRCASDEVRKSIPTLEALMNMSRGHKKDDSDWSLEHDGPTPELGPAVWKELRRLNAIDGGSEPYKVDTSFGTVTLSKALSTFVRLSWPTKEISPGVFLNKKHSYFDKDLEQKVNIEFGDFVYGHHSPLVGLGYLDTQYYIVALADDVSNDPFLYTIDHDWSGEPRPATKLSAFLRKVKPIEPKKPTTSLPPLFKAIRKRDEWECRKLIEANRGEIPEKVDGSGLTFLHYAVMGRLADVVDALLAQGHTANTTLKKAISGTKYFNWGFYNPSPEPGETPLHSIFLPTLTDDDPADIRILSALLASGAKPNARMKDGRTPLLLAVQRSITEASVDSVRLLLAACADPNAWRESESGSTVLHHAASLGKAAIVSALLDGGADPNALSADGKRPVDVAHPDTAKLLRARESRPARM